MTCLKMAAHENNSPKTTTMFVQNRNDTSDDEEMSDAIPGADAEHKRAGVSPIHIPADWGSTGDDDSVTLSNGLVVKLTSNFGTCLESGPTLFSSLFRLYVYNNRTHCLSTLLIRTLCTNVQLYCV